MVDDEKITLEQLNRLCGVKHDVFSKARIPGQHLFMKAIDEVKTYDRETRDLENNKNTTIQSKILNHFVKGKIAFSPMETILVIPG